MYMMFACMLSPKHRRHRVPKKKLENERMRYRKNEVVTGSLKVVTFEVGV